MSQIFVESFTSSKIFKLFGDHVAHASTPPEIIAVTIPEASISTAVMSSMVMPAFVRLLTRMSSLEVPEE